MTEHTWAVVVPMANEEKEFAPFIDEMTSVLDRLGSGTVYIVVDTVSKDRTRELCEELSARDPRFRTVWAPENRHVIDAYLRGFREAHADGHGFMIEMDAGMSHDPKAIPLFLEKLREGYPCVYGSRFIPGGSISGPLKRRLLSRGGTLLANVLLGTRLSDMTSGFQGFHADIIGRIIAYKLLSTAHFYQTELRYLLRNEKHAELPIAYKTPSPRVSKGAIVNAISVLFHYFILRISGRPAIIA